MKGNLYIIAGCSGVGKGTLLKLFLEKNPQIKLSISATTRQPRVADNALGKGRKGNLQIHKEVGKRKVTLTHFFYFVLP